MNPIALHNLSCIYWNIIVMQLLYLISYYKGSVLRCQFKKKKVTLRLLEESQAFLKLEKRWGSGTTFSLKPLNRFPKGTFWARSQTPPQTYVHTEHPLFTHEIPATQKLDSDKIYWQKLLRSSLGQPEVWLGKREELNQLHTNPHFKSKNTCFLSLWKKRQYGSQKSHTYISCKNMGKYFFPFFSLTMYKWSKE